MKLFHPLRIYSKINKGCHAERQRSISLTGEAEGFFFRQGGIRMTARKHHQFFDHALKAFYFSIMAVISSALFAQDQIEIVKPGGKISIAVSPLSGAAGTEATSILSSDLERSGWFKVVASGGAWSVQGSASASAVQCNVTKNDGTSVLKANGGGSLRRAAHQVTDAIVEKITGKKGIAQTHIAFISDKSGNKELYVMDYDGFNVKRFTSDKSIAGSPDFNRQGTKIAYTSYRSGYPDVYVSDYPSGSRQVVSRYPGLNSGASFSPNGAQIALTLSKDGNPELYTMSAGGVGLKRLTRTRGGESSPTWSPDGSQIAYASDQGGRPQIYIISSSGGSGSQLTTSPAYNTEPDWSPDGALIAYSSLVGGNFAVSVIDPAGGGGKVLYSNGKCEDPSWAPDGRHLVFARGAGGSSDLYILDTLTKEATQLSRDFGNCTEPSWSGR